MKRRLFWPPSWWLLALCLGVQATKDLHKSVEEPLDVTQGLYAVDFMEEHEYSSKVNMSLNPGCSYNNCTLVSGIQVSIMNVTVQDDPQQNEEQHWLWSVIGRPTVQTAITPLGDVPEIRWQSIFDASDMQKSIKYEKEPFYSGAVMLMNLIEFDDPEDEVDLSKSPSIIWPIVNFRWKREILELTEERIAVQFLGTNYTTVNNEGYKIKGSINLTMSAYSNDGFGHWLPHLSHSSQTCQVDIQLQGLNSTSGFNNSRYALEMYVVSDTDKTTPVTRQVSTTLDDEHTPGIFKTEELVLPGTSENNSTYQSYMQWRPVVYTTPSRDLSESTGVNVSSSVAVQREQDDDLNKTLLYILYGDDLNDILVRKINVTFGAPEDGYYKKHYYHAWTFTFGVGEPIRNGLSPMIILAMTAMLGALIVVIITASIVCIVKKWKKRSENFQRMN